MKRFKNRLPRISVLILVVSLFSSITSYSNYDDNSILNNGSHFPELINDGPEFELSNLNILNYFDFETFLDETDGEEIGLNDWMFSENYFDESFEAEIEIECWMFSDIYFEDLEEEIMIENWMFSDNYFETE